MCPDVGASIGSTSSTRRVCRIAWSICAIAWPRSLSRTAGNGNTTLSAGSSGGSSRGRASGRAGPRALHELREALDAATQAKLVGTLEKDLVKTPDHELWPHVSGWVSPPRRPGG